VGVPPGTRWVSRGPSLSARATEKDERKALLVNFPLQHSYGTHKRLTQNCNFLFYVHCSSNLLINLFMIDFCILIDEKAREILRCAEKDSSLKYLATVKNVYLFLDKI
jgi:hypothetical protein